MAHIEKLKSGKFKAIIEAGTTGNRKRRTKTFEKMHEAQAWMGIKISEQIKGEYVNPSQVIVKKFMLKWLESDKKPHIATTTYDNYKNRIETYIIPQLGDFQIQDVQTYHIAQFFAYLRENGAVRKDKLSENTLKKIYVLLNQCFKQAKKYHIIKSNPVEDIDSPQPEDYEAPAMSEKEVQKLLNTSKNNMYMYTYIITALFTSLRKSTMLGLEWNDIDFNKGIINVTKRYIVSQNTEDEKTRHEKGTKRKASKRKIKISERLCKILQKFKTYQDKLRLKYEGKYYDEKDFVFCKQNGRNYYPTTINDKLKALYKRAGLSKEYNVHTLRHTFGTLSAKAGTDLRIIQQMMGHGKYSTTANTYTHPDLDMQQKAIEKLDKVINLG